MREDEDEDVAELGIQKRSTQLKHFLSKLAVNPDESIFNSQEHELCG